MKAKNVSRDTIQRIRVGRISPNPDQARIDFDKAGLAELSESIKATGLLYPIIIGVANGGQTTLSMRYFT